MLRNLHLHHGVEAAYVIAPHAGFKVVGDKSIKILTVHAVDKGEPLYDWVTQ